MNGQHRKLMLMPARAGTCPECATVHEADEPHNRGSLFYQIKFRHAQGRDPTWADALAHCSEAMKAAWQEELLKIKAWSE